jgi:hypothetical protein
MLYEVEINTHSRVGYAKYFVLARSCDGAEAPAVTQHRVNFPDGEITSISVKLITNKLLRAAGE